MSTVEFEPLTVTVPLREDPPGVIRVGKTRVLLELVIRAFQRGATPEGIVQSFDTLDLSDVYAVVACYLKNPIPFEQYLRKREEAAAETQRLVESTMKPPRNLRDVILARAKAKGLLSDQTRH